MKENPLHAPDAEVILSDGVKKHLSEFWQASPVALIFLRHFG
jgi:hypothetical protein